LVEDIDIWHGVRPLMVEGPTRMQDQLCSGRYSGSAVLEALLGRFVKSSPLILPAHLVGTFRLQLVIHAHHHLLAENEHLLGITMSDS